MEFDDRLATLRASARSPEELRELSALAYVAGDRDTARRALGAAWAAHDEADDVIEAARDLLTLTRLHDDAELRLDTAERALATARRAGVDLLVLRALDQVAAARGEAGDLDGASAALADAVALADAHDDVDARRVLVRRRSAVLYAAGRPDAARETLADEIARGGGEMSGLVGATLDLAALGGAVDLAALRAVADAGEDVDARGWAALSVGSAELRAGRFAAGRDATLDAKNAGLESENPWIYLLASLQLSQAYEALGDDAAAYATLQNCRVTLEDLLGSRAGEPILPVIAAMHRRWGDDRFGRARDALRRATEAAT